MERNRFKDLLIGAAWGAVISIPLMFLLNSATRHAATDIYYNACFAGALGREPDISSARQWCERVVREMRL